MSRISRRATIRDVARQAEVSFKTVSRVINGVTTVDPGIRRRVEQAVELLDYRPNRAAQLLSGGKSSTLAVLFGKNMAAAPGSTDRMPSFAVDVLAGAMNACREAHYNLLVLEFADDEMEGRADLDRALHDLAIDGGIIMPPWCDYPWVLDYFESRNIPLARVLAGAKQDRGVAIVVDNEASGRAVADLLLDYGHRRIGLIEAPEGHFAGQSRIAAFLDRIEQRDGATVERRPGMFDFDSGHRMGGELLDLAERPTAIFAANDEMAAGVLAAAIDRDISVPAQLSIMGYGDLWVSRQTWPRLSTVHQPIVEMAQAGASTLIAAPDREGLSSVKLVRPFAIVERGTLARPITESVGST